MKLIQILDGLSIPYLTFFFSALSLRDGSVQCGQAVSVSVRDQSGVEF